MAPLAPFNGRARLSGTNRMKWLATRRATGENDGKSDGRTV